jgi:DNA-binding Lrp family transcriptional regulator
MFTEKEKKLAKHIQGDIPLEKRPFKRIGEELGLTEAEVINAINNLKKKGFLRKFGAILRHQKAGLTKNVMVIWAVPDEKCEAVGNVLASYGETTHCYERVPPFEGKYNLFAMMHFKDDNPEKLIQEISSQTGIKDYRILETKEEFKKNSMEYFE